MNKFESSTRWHARPTPSWSNPQKQWLTRPGALTGALREQGTLQLSVLAEYSDGASPDESRRLNIHAHAPVWVREIVMSIGGTLCVAARSVTSLQASHGTWQGIRKLRSRPLADILYNDVAITRSDFEVARLNRHCALYRTVQGILPELSTRSAAHKLLARRSVFWRQGSALLVAECFLPDFWRLIVNQNPTA